jgi:predicted alpha-1,2-mannosidase
MLRSAGILFFSVLTCSFLYAQGVGFEPQSPAYVVSPSVTSYVNPLIGTAKMGHTYPGATVPFGMVQLSPDTDTLQYELDGKYNRDVYKYCAGYQYTDKTIVGFSHTHFSGTGHSDLGDILVMPTTGTLQLNPGTADLPENGFRSAFSHTNEKASPNYYAVQLDDHRIKAELTTSARVGVHRYTFPQSDQAHIILDLVSGIYNYENKNVWTFVRVENDSLITGYRQTNGWGRTRTVYFAIAFSKKFTHYGYRNFAKKEVYKGFWRKFDQYNDFPEMAGTQLRAHFDFDTQEGEAIVMKVALSSVSTEGALLNMNAEVPGWDFDLVHEQGKYAWEQALGKVQAQFMNNDDRTSFYTALYHTMLGPTTYMDVDGRYRGLDQNIHRANGFENYTTFSLWDTYRALHPLLNMLEPERNSDMISSMLAHYDQSAHDLLPVWSHYANDNWCMIGYHSVSVIADAIIKGTNKFDAKRALDACVTTARHRNYDGLGYYMDLGYVPEDKNGSSVSKTLEYAYDDWCIAQIAQKLGRQDIYNEFMQRAGNYKNVFDPSIGFMRPKLSDGTFKPGFDVLNTHGEGFIEGNSWNYSLYVPHQPDSLIALMGGKKRFSEHLDSLFTMELPDKYFAETEDISRDGIIGNYVHGNEPSHHAAYLFNSAGTLWKTQEKVRQIMQEMYRPAADGLGGNDDCGQMSAWYIFSALGFYPVAPGSDRYELGSPIVETALLNLPNGNHLIIRAEKQSPKNVYVSRVELNGKTLDRTYITHEEITQGGELIFHMSSKPKKK